MRDSATRRFATPQEVADLVILGYTGLATPRRGMRTPSERAGTPSS